MMRLISNHIYFRDPAEIKRTKFCADTLMTVVPSGHLWLGLFKSARRKPPCFVRHTNEVNVCIAYGIF